MYELNSKEIQAQIFNILCAFVDYCETNNLSYRMCGGTMLGAIRHEGFIPWDDDIDISMPRPDYDRFLKLVTTLPLSSDFTVISFENGELEYPFAKIVDLTTKIEKSEVGDDGTDWLWIDILPVDGLPDSKQALKKHYQKITFYRKLLMLSLSTEIKSESVFKKIIKVIATPFTRLLPTRFYCKKIDKLAKKYKYETSLNVGVVGWGLYGVSEIVNKEDYETIEDKLFLGKKLHAFKNWEKYLTNLYGDYMQLPPEEKRKTHAIKAWRKD